MFRSDCVKCNGVGVLRAFHHVQAGRCFSCDGLGYFETKTDPKVLAKRRAARKAKRDALEAVRIAELQKDPLNTIEGLTAKYQDDDRIGADTRRRCTHPVFAWDVYNSLRRVDAGTYGGERYECATARFLQNIAD